MMTMLLRQAIGLPVVTATVTVIVTALAAGDARAQNYPWCANFADGAGTNCGFATYEQCMATSMGSGGSCTQNNLYRPAAAATPSRHPPRKRHSGKPS